MLRQYLESMVQGNGLGEVDLYAGPGAYLYDESLEEYVNLIYLGQGWEKIAWSNEDGDTVYVATEAEHPDESLAQLSYLCSQSLDWGQPPNPHLPCVIWVGTAEGEPFLDIWKMPYYSLDLGTVALNQFEFIEYLLSQTSHQTLREIVTLAQDIWGNSPPEKYQKLIQAVQLMAREDDDDGWTYALDWSRSNVGQDGNGDLVLFDAFYVDVDEGMSPEGFIDHYRYPPAVKPIHLSTEEWLQKINRRPAPSINLNF